MSAVSAKTFFQQVCACLHRITAGSYQCRSFAFPERWPPFFSIIFIHAIDKSVQCRLHRRSPGPAVYRRCQKKQISFPNRIENFLHTVVLNTAEHAPVFLTSAAGKAGFYIFHIQRILFAVMTQFQQRLPHRFQKLRRISLRPWTCKQNTYLHQIASCVHLFCHSTISQQSLQRYFPPLSKKLLVLYI